MEHRCGLRRPARFIINFRRPGALPAAGEIQDISASGALIHSSSRLPQNTFVLVQLATYRNPVPAEVVRATREGFAVEWVEFSPDEVRATIRSLYKQDPEHPAGYDAR